jgi:hypothetical protein
MKTTDPPSGVVEWYSGKTGERAYMHLKAKLTGRRMPDGTQYSSIVNLSEADADRLIANIKKDSRGYPGFNHGGGGAKFYENYEAYQRWLVEEYLETPFRDEVDDKIEDAAARRRIDDAVKKAKEKKEKAQAFISKTSTFRPGKKISLKTTKMTGIVPKRAVPVGVDQKIAPEQSEEGGIEPTKTMISSLGRVTLDLVQINDNLDAIREVIIEDYKATKETNQKETEEYKKRIANRGRKFVKKDLGDKKKNVGEIIKPFVGSFFSGLGGSLRALAGFKLIDALINGDYAKAFQSLLGIGITFIPQIASMLVGAIFKSLLKGFGRRSFGGGFGGGRVGSPRMRGGGMGGIGKFGAALSLGTGALALGSSFASSQEEEISDTQPQEQTRLEQLTAEQKGLTDQGIGVITQQDLKRFEELNKKFDSALELLLMKPSRGNNGMGGGQSGSGGAPDVSTQGVQPIGPVAADQQQAYQMVYDAAVKAGSPDPHMTASIAMLESGWMNPNLTKSKYNQSGRTNPFGQTGSGTRGSVNGFAVYNNLEEGVAAHVNLWKRYYGSTPEESVRKMRDAGYNREGGGGPWMRKVLGIYQGMNRSQPPAQPAPPRRDPNQVSAAPSNGRGVLVSLKPQSAGGNDLGSAAISGTDGLASVDMSGSDIYSKLTQAQLNIVNT